MRGARRYADDLLRQVCGAAEVGKGRSSGCVRRWGRQWRTTDSTSVPGRRSRSRAPPGQTAATHALASAAYRDSADRRHPQGQQRVAQVRGEEAASCRSSSRTWARRSPGPCRCGMLGGARKRAHPVLRHRAADRSSSTAWRRPASARSATPGSPCVMVLFGLLFLPGLLLWLLVFQLRRTIAGRAGQAGGRARHGRCWSALGGLAVIFLIKLPFTGFWALLPARHARRPGRRLAAGQADLRAHGEGPARPLGQPAGRRRRRRQDPRGGARQPRRDARAEQLRQGLAKLAAEQQSNSVFYAGPKGILGMGTRWGSWQLAEELVSKDADARRSTRSAAGTSSARSTTSCACWSAARCTPAASPSRRYGTGSSPRSARAPRRSPGPRARTSRRYQIKDHEIQRICNEQQFGSGNRHYLGVQFDALGRPVGDHAC